MADDFTNRAAEIAVKTAEDNLIQAERDYQDAQRSGDDTFAGGDALLRWDAAKAQYERLTGANQPQQQQQAGQLSVAQRNYLSRRAYGGDQLTPRRMADYAKGHERAVAAGFQQDSPGYFSCVSNYVDTWVTADNRRWMNARRQKSVASTKIHTPPMRTTCERSNETAITEIEVQPRRKFDHG